MNILPASWSVDIKQLTARIKIYQLFIFTTMIKIKMRLISIFIGGTLLGMLLSLLIFSIKPRLLRQITSDSARMKLKKSGYQFISPLLECKIANSRLSSIDYC